MNERRAPPIVIRRIGIDRGQQQIFGGVKILPLARVDALKQVATSGGHAIRRASEDRWREQVGSSRPNPSKWGVYQVWVLMLRLRSRRHLPRGRRDLLSDEMARTVPCPTPDLHVLFPPAGAAPPPPRSSSPPSRSPPLVRRRRLCTSSPTRQHPPASARSLVRRPGSTPPPRPR